MRQIKFRGKSKETGKWVYGSLLIEEAPLVCFTSDQKEEDKYYIGKSGFADWNMPRPFETTEVDPSTVGQWTGLVDKYDRDIYEDDIVKDLYDRNEYRVWQIYGKWLYGGIDKGWDNYLGKLNTYAVEVVDNIHDKEVSSD